MCLLQTKRQKGPKQSFSCDLNIFSFVGGTNFKDKIMKLQSLIEKNITQVQCNTGMGRMAEVMQSLLGSPTFICRAIIPSRPFCHRLINATRGIAKPYHHIRISKAMRLVLHTWLTFFKSFNGISFGIHS